VNLVGGLTLVFQCSLQRLEAKFLERHPDCPQVVADVLFGHFWLRGTLNCDTDAARASTFMIAGWLVTESLKSNERTNEPKNRVVLYSLCML